jgi:ABC-type nitrate/sulfonate/bicarbonate transport system substrate-binding protein
MAAAVACVVALAHPAFSQETSKNGIRTLSRASMSRTAMEWPVFVATHKGFFAREKLAVKTAIISPANITGSLIGGAVEIGFVSATGLVLAVQKGADIVAIGQGLDPAPYFLMVPGSIKSIADLKGKIIAAATPGDVYTTVLKQIIRKGGLDPEKDVHLFYGSNSNQRMAALINGAASAALMLPPQTGTLEAKGFHSLAFTPDLYPRLTLSLTAVRKDWAAKNDATLRAYMRAIGAADTWLNDPANRQEAMDILVKEKVADEKAATEAYDVFVRKIHNFPNDGCIQTKGMEKLVSMLQQMGGLKGDAPASKFVDTKWCPK